MRNRWFKWTVLISALIGFTPLTSVAQVDLISPGAAWKYLDNGSDQGTAWTGTGFSDATWPSGPAPLGYGEEGLATTNSFGGDDTNKFATTYYRHTFNLASPSSITNLRAQVRRDDGVIVYLNGAEVYREFVTNDPVSYLDFASQTAPDDGGDLHPFNIPASLLVSGNNVVAAEIHQANATSSDIVFDLNLEGNPLPEIAITSPTNGQVIASANVLIQGTAIPGGPDITLIELFAGAVKVGQSTSGDFSVLWQNVTPGEYTLTARITDSSGLTATSAPVGITVQAPPAGTLVGNGEIWKYYIGATGEASTPSTLWRGPGFDDSSWPSGPTPIGYGESDIATTIRSSSTAPTYTSLYCRKSFQVVNPTSYSQLDMEVIVDDGAVAYINGVEIGRINVPAGELIYSDVASVADERRTLSVTINNPGSILVAGNNVFAIHVLNGNTTSSDILVDGSLLGTVDTEAPIITDWDPAVGSILIELTSVNVIFSESVTGVDAGDLLINGEAATGLIVISPREYTFMFPAAEAGTVSVGFIAGHGITDLAPSPNAFGGGSWTYTVDPNASSTPTLLITEVVARGSDLDDEEGSSEDWIEILNLGPLSANLDGYYLTDDPDDLTKWRFSTTPVLLGEHLIVWASGNNRTNYLGLYDAQQDIVQSGLHTSFGLSGGGEYVALVDPTGTNILSDFYFPAFPADQTVSYGRDPADPDLLGFYSPPTPGAPNTVGGGDDFAPEPVFSIPGGFYPDASLSLTLSSLSGTIRYTVDGSVPTQASPVYTGPITINNSAVVKARVFQSPLLPSAIGVQAYNLAGTGLASEFTSKLPIMIINTLGGGEPRTDNVRIPATITVIDTFRGAASIEWTPQFQGLCQIERRGQSSQGWPKGQYRVEINDPYGNDLEVPLVGLPDESDWVLNGPYPDKTFLNNFLAYEMYEEMGHYSVRRRLVELFLDTNGGDLTYPGDYRGIYLLVENIKRDNNRVDIEELSPVMDSEPDISGGYIFVYDPGKASPTDYVFYDSSHTDDAGLKIREPKPDEFRLGIPARTNQINWIANYLARFEAAAYASDWLTRTGPNHYSAYIDVDSFVDAHWIVEFAKQIDGYRLSNYFSKDRGGKLRMSPIWDWNLSFGNANYLDGGNTNQWYFTLISDNQHIWLSRLIDTPGDPDFIQRITDRWGVLRTNVMYGPKVLNRVDEMSSLLMEAAARDDAKWNRFNTYLWPNPEGGTFYVDYTQPTYEAIISEMKKWIEGRFNWIENQFIRAPQLSFNGGTVEPGTLVIVSALRGTIYYTLDGTDPRAPGGSIRAGAQTYSGPVAINNNARIFARAYVPGNTTLGGPWSPPVQATYVVSVPPLIVSELMYHPTPPPTNSTYLEDDYQYIELKNIGDSVLSLEGYSFVNGIQFTFTGASALSLDPGETAVLIRNLGAITERYGSVNNIAGVFTNNFANAGERVTLLGPMQEVVHDFTYDDDWYPATDGLGFALVVADEAQDRALWNQAAGWRAGTVLGGTPGEDEPAAPNIPLVLINEALTHSDLPLVDFIELYNPNGATVNVGGWWLSDDFRTPKYMIPTGPSADIAPGGYLVIDATQYGNINNTPTPFDLRSAGDEVALYSGDSAGNLTGYMHAFSYGAALNGVSFGRHVTSLGEEHFVAQSAVTMGADNSGPKVGPLVISEIMYRPSDVETNGAFWNNDEDEYVELANISGAPVQLWDPNATTNTWRLTDAVKYAFPPGTTMNTGERLLVVSFSPTNAAAVSAFRARMNVSPSVRLFGPFDGRLNNAGESVELLQPDVVRFYVTNVVITGVLIDKVRYQSLSPWPVAADGIGRSLQRKVETDYGDDPTNWVAAQPSPGAGYVGGDAPLIVTQPLSQTIVAFQNVTLSVTATGAGPISYQWRFNNDNLPGATDAFLTLNNVQASQSGLYQVVVMNPANSVVSDTVSLNVLIPIDIEQQPESLSVKPGTNVTFIVVATSTTPIYYQWRFNGVPIPGATTPLYSIPNVQRVHDGIYDCVLTDDIGPVVTEPARLTVLINPVITDLTTQYTVVQGGNVTMSIGADGSLPMSYRWRSNYYTLKLETIDSLQSYMTLNNVQPSAGGTGNRYTVVLTNAAFSTPGVLSPTIYLTVLADADGDGLPDQWEALYGVDDPNLDDDHDGMTNGEEYTAGTDPTDGDSYLRIEQLSFGSGANIAFLAASNRTYTLQYKDSLDELIWNSLADVPAHPTNRTATVNDPEGSGKRFYRLGTPKLE